MRVGICRGIRFVVFVDVMGFQYLLIFALSHKLDFFGFDFGFPFISTLPSPPAQQPG